MDMNHAITYFSAFSGIGGFELALSRCRQNMQCVGFSEIDTHAHKVYTHHFPNHQNYGDIRAINANSLPDFNLLVGGFPCQAFSFEGHRRGLDDRRGALFFEIARLAREKQPRTILLENVKGLLSHGAGHTCRAIISTLDELGYDLQWQVLDSQNFGVPQRRERIFIVGHLRGPRRPNIFPLRTAAAKLPHQQVSQPGRGRVRSIWSLRDSESTRRAILDRHSIRRLTPVECERLQGYPDGWTQGISIAQRYKALGNAVTVPVVEAIAQRLYR
jgi:DNA (cytosine-5)-methyltransferase 1